MPHSSLSRTVCHSVLAPQGRGLRSGSRESIYTHRERETHTQTHAHARVHAHTTQALDNGRLREEGDVYFDFVELEEDPLKNLLITNKCVLPTNLGFYSTYNVCPLSLSVVFW